MSQESRYEFLLVVRWRYAGRGRQGRGRLLDEVCAICGVSRKHAIELMGGRMGMGAPGSRRGGPRKRYGPEEAGALKLMVCRRAALRQAAGGGAPAVAGPLRGPPRPGSMPGSGVGSWP